MIRFFHHGLILILICLSTSCFLPHGPEFPLFRECRHRRWVGARCFSTAVDPIYLNEITPSSEWVRSKKPLGPFQCQRLPNQLGPVVEVYSKLEGFKGGFLAGVRKADGSRQAYFSYLLDDDEFDTPIPINLEPDALVLGSIRGFPNRPTLVVIQNSRQGAFLKLINVQGQEEVSFDLEVARVKSGRVLNGSNSIYIAYEIENNSWRLVSMPEYPKWPVDAASMALSWKSSQPPQIYSVRSNRGNLSGEYVSVLIYQKDDQSFQGLVVNDKGSLEIFDLPIRGSGRVESWKVNSSELFAFVERVSPSQADLKLFHLDFPIQTSFSNAGWRIDAIGKMTTKQLAAFDVSGMHSDEVFIDDRDDIYLMQWKDREASIARYHEGGESGPSVPQYREEFNSYYGIFPGGSQLLDWVQEQDRVTRVLIKDRPEDGGELRYCIFKTRR